MRHGGEAVVRGLALACGALLVFGACTRLAGTHDFSLWLVDLRALPAWAGTLAVASGGLALPVWGVVGNRHQAVRWAAVVAGAVFALFAAANAGGVVSLLAKGTIRNPLPVPLSALYAVGFTAVALRALRGGTASHGEGHGPVAVAWAAVFLAAFPVLQAFGFGHTDYAAPADWAVVPGARVHADGTLSMAADDRVRTAAALYRAGTVRRLVMSGGPGDGAVHETEAMRDRAVSLGVRREDILLDRGGLNTASTVVDTLRMARAEGGPPRLLVVSEFYHLPRLKLAYARAGAEVRTVPAVPGHWLRRWPVRSLLREIPAFWSYALRPARAFRPAPAAAGPPPPRATATGRGPVPADLPC